MLFVHPKSYSSEINVILGSGGLCVSLLIFPFHNPSTMTIINKTALQKAINVRDLSNPEEGDHAIQLLIHQLLTTLSETWGSQVHIYRESPIVSIQDNYDRLRYPKDGPARAARYTRYVCDTALLRTSTTAMIPRAMQTLSHAFQKEDLIACPGLVYRRDCIDRLHLAEIHQMDVWRLSSQSLNPEDLHQMIDLVISTMLPEKKYRTEAREHPYTLHGLQIDIHYMDQWIEVGECGLAHPDILAQNLPTSLSVSGLAIGLGLDRILMIRKGMKDVRLVASSQPNISRQMFTLDPYQEVSTMPAVTRDLSLVLNDTADAEIIGDKIREVLGEEADIVESINIKAESTYESLSHHVVDKLGMEPGQKNVLLQVVFRALGRTLTDEACNVYRDKIYAGLHQGLYWEWATHPER